MYFDYVIVGAGLSGIVCANKLAENKTKKILIIEKRSHLGGNLYDYYNEEGILIHKYGPHIFRTDNQHIWDYLSTYTNWNYYQHKVIANVKGIEVPFPINLDTYNKLLNTNLSQMEFDEKLKSFQFTCNPNNSEEAIINQVGEYLYETFFKNYTIKQWGKHPIELHPDTVKRVSVRRDKDNRYFSDKYQGVPKYGYTYMLGKMIQKSNIHVLLNTDYKEIIESLDYNKLIYTGAIDYFFDYKYGKLEYRSLIFREETFDTDCYQTSAVVNYPNNYDFTRITEYKKLTGQKHHKTTIQFEYPIEYVEKKNEPYYPILDNKNTLLKESYLKDAEKLQNVMFIGRLAEYKYYSMEELIENILENIIDKL